jgi:hypothetical protein
MAAEKTACQISVRFTVEELVAIKAAAEREFRSMSEQVRWWVHQGLRAKVPEPDDATEKAPAADTAKA